MKIQIQFIDLSETPKPGCDVAMILPRSRWDKGDIQLYSCRQLASRTSCAVITAPFAAPGFYGICCCTSHGDFFQPVCFPDQALKEYAGEDISVIELPFGKIALCCAEDIFQPQYARTAALRGCDLLAVSYGGKMDEEHIMAGPWSCVQANCLPACLAMPGGGRLILPCDMTEDLSGFGRSAFETDEVKNAYKKFPVFDALNRSFYRNYEKELSSC